MLRRAFVGCVMVLVVGAAAAAEAPLQLESTIPLPGVKGRIDHLAVDLEHHRLFIAALGNDTVEVLDTEDDTRRTLPGSSEPQGVLYIAESNRLFIASGGAGRVEIMDAASSKVVQRIEHLDDADNMRYDAATHRVYVGYGKGALRVLDATSGESVGDIALPGHPESFELERGGERAFVNVPSARAVVVVSRGQRSILAKWGTGDASGNFAMALDQDGRRLFVAARSPAVLLVYDLERAAVIARVPIGGDADDLFFDPAHRRIYAICGAGVISVIRQETPDSYALETSLATAPRARTGLFVPEQKRLYVAAPASGGAPARVLVLRVR